MALWYVKCFLTITSSHLGAWIIHLISRELSGLSAFTLWKLTFAFCISQRSISVSNLRVIWSNWFLVSRTRAWIMLCCIGHVGKPERLPHLNVWGSVLCGVTFQFYHKDTIIWYVWRRRAACPLKKPHSQMTFINSEMMFHIQLYNKGYTFLSNRNKQPRNSCLTANFVSLPGINLWL